MIEVQWLGHSCFLIRTDKHKILVDPFLDDSPTAPIKSDKVEAEFILITHGHGDHCADAVKIAKRTGAKVVSNYEISLWLGKQGVKDVVGMNHGGATTLPFGRVKMTVAH